MTPIKRHKALQPLSHEHHQGLLAAWKIRMGLRKSIEPERIKKFSDFFYKQHLAAHFALEEKYIYPILGDKNELIEKALAEHRSLRGLFEQQDADPATLSLIEQQLDEHIRFEERELFNEVQDIATEEELNQVLSVHSGGKEEIKNIESWKDEFWTV
jgi:hemerythrin-like domain-containing protein